MAAEPPARAGGRARRPAGWRRADRRLRGQPGLGCPPLGRVAALLLMLAIGSSALACGYCIEDRIAAVYDHAQVQAALAARRQVAYVAVQGAATDPAATRAALAESLSAAPGVQKDSLRFSPETLTAAFVFDPAAAGSGAVVQALNQSLAAQGLQLGLMRVIDAPGQLRPASP